VTRGEVKELPWRVFEAANKRGDGTSSVMDATSMRQVFATDHVLLVVGDLELGTGCAVQSIEGAGHKVQDNVANTELDIANAERVDVSGGKAIFAGA
jgi:hypothetical protein